MKLQDNMRTLQRVAQHANDRADRMREEPQPGVAML